MSLRSSLLALAALVAVAALPINSVRTADGEAVLRVCADPNNLPFSNRSREGFENRIAELLARDLDATVEYTWWAQRRGFIRNTLQAGTCDVVIGVPSGFEMATVSRPYYRSSYAFVYPKGSGRSYRSLDDETLRKVKIGIHVIGDDYANSPPVHALAYRGITNNLSGYRVQGDYRRDSPPAELIRAVARGEVDVAIAWGPLAGYHARRQTVPLEVTVVTPELDRGVLPLTYSIGLGVRHGEQVLLDQLERILLHRSREVRRILTDFHVPLLPLINAPENHRI